MRPSATDRPRAIRGEHAVPLALTIADVTPITDPGELVDESIRFWQVTAAFASSRTGVTVPPPAGTAGVQAVVNALRTILDGRQRRMRVVPRG